MFNKIRNSLVVQTNFLFLVSILFICALWLFFYLSQKHQDEEHNMARYFNTATTVQPMMMKNQNITQENLLLLGMVKYEGNIPKKYEILFEKGNVEKGFRLINFGDKKILHINNPNGELYLEDIHKQNTMVLIHLVFMILLIAQILLYLKLKNSLSPLSLLSKKLKNLEQGDRTPLDIDSSYEEIDRIITSYNHSISKIDYMLETREMFNKIFMHEMKMPLAKGMFYLKLEPSQKSHEKLQNILNTINQELEEFSQIESLITYQNDISKEENSFVDILNIAKSRVDVEDESIEVKNIDDLKLKGDKEFWTLCIKNLIDNAIKYSHDKKLIIDGKDGISFINSGDALPVDISKDITKWKIDKDKRHKSSTGYGFGLFIIKNIVTLHGYSLEYSYDEVDSKVVLRII